MMPLKNKMDPSTLNSISASPSEDMGAPEKMNEMEQVSSDLKSLKTLYGLLHRGPTDETLDETSRAFMTKMLDDITRQTLRRQAKILSPTLERKLFIRSDHRRTRGDAVPVPVVKPIASFSPILHASERSSRLRTQGAVRSRDSRHGKNDRLLARVASNRSSKTAVAPHHRRQSPERRLDRLASHRSSRAVTPQRGTVAGVTPRSDMMWPRRGDDSSMERSSSRHRSLSRVQSVIQEQGRGLHRGASPAAPRVGAEGSSTLERPDSGLSMNLVPPLPLRGSQRGGRGAATTPKLSSSTDAAVTIRRSIRPSREFIERSPRRAGEAGNDSPRRRRGKEIDDAASVSKGWPSRGELSSMERGSSSRRSLSREPSLGVQERARGLHRGASPAALRVGAEGSSTRRLERLDSGLSLNMVSRRGSQRGGRGTATPKLSSSTDAAATTRSHIRLNRDITERSLRRAGEADEDESPRRRRGKGKEKADDDAASVSMGRPSRPPRRALNRINSGSTYSSSSSCCPPEPTSNTSCSTSSWVPLPPRGNAPSWVPLPPRRNAPPEYGFHVSGASRSRHLRRQERLERRVERMRRFKNKLGMVFHHLHHHHHFGPSGSREGPPRLFSRDVHDRDHHRPSTWKVLGGVLHRATRRGEKKTWSVQANRRGGGVGQALFHMWSKRRAMAKQHGGGVGRALFQMWGKRRASAKRRGGGVGHALFHMWGKRRATASAGMWGTGSRRKAKKLHWWQRMRPRRRSGHEKALR